MNARFRTWLNSMQAHMIGFAFAVIVVLTAINVTFVVIAGPPQRSPMTVYDISRVIRGLPPAQESLAEEFTVSKSLETRPPASQVERELSRFLARDLHMPVDDVRLHLGNRSLTYFDYLEKQAALYAQDGKGGPIIYGTVVATVRQADGTWNIYTRRSKEGLANYWNLLRASPWLGFLVLVPLSMWFSAMITRPVRAFAQAVGRVRDARAEFSVPVAGPTEIRVAATALNEMQARIRKYLRERTALVGAIAHDLRTPLNNLRFRLAAAPDEIRVPAESDIHQLEQLINSTLDYVESEGMTLSIETIDLPSLLESIGDNNSYLQKDISFVLENVRIEGDILMLRRLFSNLIGNALKYGSRVSIVLRSTTDDAVVEVADDGPGMAPTDLPRAFEPFFRGERSRSRMTGGIGLGLTIAKTVIEAHGGEIALENRHKGGLLARVTLPLHRIAGRLPECSQPD